MRFALVGENADGWEMARALVLTGRHELAVVSGLDPMVGKELLARMKLQSTITTDFEEVLADPLIEAVIVAGRLDVRPALLRRALQSERHVLCVYPPDLSLDIAYEAVLIQQDTKCLLLPLLPEPFHPALTRLMEWMRSASNPTTGFRLLQLERWSKGPIASDSGAGGMKPCFRDWSILRALGGEIVEVSAFASGEESNVDEPLLLSGKFENGGLFQATLLPGRGESRWRLLLIGDSVRAELTFAAGWPGQAVLRWTDAKGETREESFDSWDPWPAMVQAFEAAGTSHPHSDAPSLSLSWQDAIRCLELDDAARRSVEKRRSSVLEYQEVSEAVGFKGTMTLVGCGMLWGMLLLLMLSVWQPRLIWLTLPMILLFLALQLLRWIIPSASVDSTKQP